MLSAAVTPELPYMAEGGDKESQKQRSNNNDVPPMINMTEVKRRLPANRKTSRLVIFLAFIYLTNVSVSSSPISSNTDMVVGMDMVLA